MMQPGMIQPNAGTTMNNQQQKPEPPSKNIIINFFVTLDEIIIGIQGNTNMSVQQLIKLFKRKLDNNKITISKYITYPTNIELKPDSTKTLAQLGIDEKITINAIVK